MPSCQNILTALYVCKYLSVKSLACSFILPVIQVVFQQVKAFLQPPMEGIVLETYGCGNAPNNRPDLLEELRQATQRNVVILNCTQCLRGSVASTYATGQVMETVQKIVIHAINGQFMPQ